MLIDFETSIESHLSRNHIDTVIKDNATDNFWQKLASSSIPPTFIAARQDGQ